jgi:DNA invertase Pin-like site-specific DNA recombinase
LASLTALKVTECGKIFADKATGTNTKRPALEKCLNALKAGDVLWKLDRLGRSLRDLIALLDDLRDVAFQSSTEAIDTDTPTGRAMWQMVGILAELEKSLIQERTKAGRAAAVARGVRMGRKRLLSAQQVAHARKLMGQGEGADNVAQSLNVSRRTLYRALALRA